MTERRMLWFGVGLVLCFGLWLALAGRLAGNDGVRVADSATIDKVKATWRAHADTAEQIFAKVSTAAHFVPRELELDRKTDTGEPVAVSWAKRSDKIEKDYTVALEGAPDGTVRFVTPYAKPIEPGWRSFAHSLIADEIANNERGVNRRRLHDSTNVNFVTTAQSKLGDHPRRGTCRIGDTVGGHYLLLDGTTCRR
ncbi:hypothetical protein QA640_38990 [Bradyrhizobium sp. CB82]|uniref:hypothetical protein n=1 Tax=Bradyrhizobium sp. CB82 TaxID=3039159 RepID=UPI0024B11F52|nr:hypothetical protein [Bradyrhizobium sp. CB82]WFU40138.1 hypothetical protein QA640_38990 [Bradyrhizobium sp. CB82]